ncbi:MAG: hypothetical protein KIT22_19955, partial [Verrucomicrobiae bacterium]|nr:hypothetical protein [Verrucomicrobiae bacterium]
MVTVAALAVQSLQAQSWTGATDVFPEGLSPVPATGSVITNANSFTLNAGGLAAFDRVDAATSLTTGDTSFFRFEDVTGDFDKKIRLVSLTAEPIDATV